jgi:hypothetical protein
MTRLFALPAADRLPPAIVLFFDAHAHDPATQTQRFGVELRDAANRAPIAALTLRDAHAFLVGHGYRWEPALEARWVRGARA